MFEIYRKMVNLQAFKVLTKFPNDPCENLAIGEDEVLHSLSLVIPARVKVAQNKPVVNYGIETPYEKTAVNGAGDTLTLENFETQNFNLGSPYDTP